MCFIESSEQASFDTADGFVDFEHQSMIQNDWAGKPWCRFACRA